MKKFIGIIPARTGSKSIIDKNILKLGDHPLIAYSIAAAQISTNINRVIVSTDSEKYREIAKRYGAEVPFLRPKNFAEDTSVDRDFFLHAINWFKVNEKKSPEFFVHLRPTTPLREPEVINQAIKSFLANEEATSLRSAHLAPESPMKWFTKDDIYFKGFVDKELSNLPKESFKKTYIPNGYVDIVRSSIVEDNYEIHGSKILGFETKVTNEVDSLEEFEYISFQLKTNGSVLKNYLDKLYK